MKLLIFFLRLKLKRYFVLANWKQWLTDSCSIFLSITIGIGVGTQYDAFIIKQNPLSPSLLSVVFSCLYVMPFVLRLCISGFNKLFYLSKHYPILKKEAVALDLLLFGFSRSINFSLSAFLLSFCLSSKHITPIEGVNGFLYLIIGIMFSENFVNAISFGKVKYIIISLLFFSIFSFASQGLHLSPLLTSFLALTIVLLSYLYWNQYEISSNKLWDKDWYYHILHDLHLKIAYGNALYSKSLITSIAFKIGAFIYLIYLSKFKYTKTSEIVTLNKAMLIILLPLILFTYIYNNLWGYFKTLALNLIITGNNWKAFISHYWKLLRYVLLMDFTISFTLLVAFGLYKFIFFIEYFFFLLYAIAIGSFGSFLKYSKIENSMSFTSVRGNASILINILLLASSIPLVLFNEHEFYSYAFLLLPVAMLALTIFIYKSSNYYIIRLFKKRFVKSLS